VKIGVFDSGKGGLTVLLELRRVLPKAEYIYFGDYENLPYGDKSVEFIRNRTIEIISDLCNQNVDLIVIACNTVSSVALNEARVYSSVPVIDMISPTLLFLEKYKNIGVAATTRTVHSGVFKNMKTVACPDLVPLIEANKCVQEAIEGYFSELKNSDIVVLACTHYPIIQDKIEKYLGNIPVINPAVIVADYVVKFVNENYRWKVPRKAT